MIQFSNSKIVYIPLNSPEKGEEEKFSSPI